VVLTFFLSAEFSLLCMFRRAVMCSRNSVILL